MIVQTMTKTKAKPFLKWAGGKTQLLPTIDSFLPDTFRCEDDVTYIEPFVGGGAMLFYMLQKYPNIKRAVINDINPHLIKTYGVIRDEPFSLIDALKSVCLSISRRNRRNHPRSRGNRCRRRCPRGNAPSHAYPAWWVVRAPCGGLRIRRCASSPASRTATAG